MTFIVGKEDKLREEYIKKKTEEINEIYKGEVRPPYVVWNYYFPEYKGEVKVHTELRIV